MSRVILEVDRKSMAWLIRKSFSKNRMLWFYGTSSLLSFIVFVLFWCTNIFPGLVLSKLELRNNSDAFYFWQRPSVSLIYEIYVFNYTNVDDFEAGRASKLRVQELGPYVYKETLSRVNLEFHDNGTITYQEKRSFEWISGRSDEESVVVPNVPLIGAVAYSRDFHFVAQMGVTVFLATVRAKPFIKVSAGEFLWGYDDNIFKMGKSLQLFKRKVPFEKFGILAFKNGLNGDRITIHTGNNDLDHLGLIQSINGLEDRHVWGDKLCDKIQGTDGSMFPPRLVRDPNNTLYIYAKDICRNIPFRYEGRAFSRGIPALRYKMPADVFTSTSTKDTCYCSVKTDAPVCPPSGILNVSVCNFESPLLISFPHFYSGAKSLLEPIDGLNPHQEAHESYIDLHPRLALPIDGRSRFQINVEIRKTPGVPLSEKLKEGLILPLIWIDAGVDTLPESIEADLQLAHYTVNALEAGFQWCSLIGLIIFLGAFVNASRQQTRERPAEGKRPPE